MPPCIDHMELLAWMQGADFSEHIQRFILHGNPLNFLHFDAPNTKFAPTGYRRAPNIISHQSRHVPWQKIKVQDPQGPASSIHFRIFGSQGPASSIHFRILGFQGPTFNIHFRIQGSQGPTSGIHFRILGSQGPASSIHFRILGFQGPMSSTHVKIRNPQDPITSTRRYALQDTVFPRSHEFMTYHLQRSTASPKAYHLQPTTSLGSLGSRVAKTHFTESNFEWYSQIEKCFEYLKSPSYQIYVHAGLIYKCRKSGHFLSRHMRAKWAFSTRNFKLG